MELSNTKYRAKYAIYGAMVGDALGSTLEFETSSKAKKLLSTYGNFADGLVGKGPFNLVPGQFTDDSEMALAIMSVIHKYGFYSQRLVAVAYHKWYNSNPFDMGNTTKTAVCKSNNIDMMNEAKNKNSTSLSNGFLMRLYGLVAMYYDQPTDKLIAAITEDVKLTHGHPETIHIAVIYGLMLYFAINGKSSLEIYSWGKSHSTRSPLFTAIYTAVETNSDEFVYLGTKYNIDQIDSNLFGFVGFAIWLLLRCLNQFKSYRESILYVVSFGGDTDTNACIVGSVMAALYPSTLPVNWIRSLVNFSDPDRFKNYPIADPKVWTKYLH